MIRSPRDASEDARLLAAAADGDDLAFGTPYRRWLPVVVRWCLRETANRETAADLAAEVFAAAPVSARRYCPEQGPVVAWLLGIARNKLRESRRRKRVEDSARRRLGLDPIPVCDADLERVEALASLDGEILARLSFTGRLHDRTVACGKKTVALKHGRLTATFKLGPRTAAHATTRSRPTAPVGRWIFPSHRSPTRMSVPTCMCGQMIGLSPRGCQW